MTDKKYSHLMKLTANELHNHLVQRNTPRASREYIEQIVAEQKENARIKKIKRAAHKKLWAVVLEPLRSEIRSTRSSLAYDKGEETTINISVGGTATPNPDHAELRRAAHAYYETVLLKVQRQLTHIKTTLDATPSEAAAEASIPNKGEHWADWVPSHIKAKATDLFDAVPHKPKAKRKIPFERNIPAESQIAKLQHKRAIIEGKLEGMEQVMNIYSGDARYERMGEIKDMQNKIDDAKSKIKEIDRQLADL
jgi:hypothetical protein